MIFREKTERAEKTFRFWSVIEINQLWARSSQNDFRSSTNKLADQFRPTMNTNGQCKAQKNKETKSNVHCLPIMISFAIWLD